MKNRRYGITDLREGRVKLQFQEADIRASDEKFDHDRNVQETSEEEAGILSE